MELQSDERDLRGDPGHHGLHRLVLRDAHVLERSRQENHPVCDGERKVRFISINLMIVLEQTDCIVLPISCSTTVSLYNLLSSYERLMAVRGTY